MGKNELDYWSDEFILHDKHNNYSHGYTTIKTDSTVPKISLSIIFDECN